MTMFASAHGVGIACDQCRRETFGSYRTYSELLRQRPGWTLSTCPACRGDDEAGGTSDELG
jgi:hypothetical protein